MFGLRLPNTPPPGIAVVVSLHVLVCLSVRASTRLLPPASSRTIAAHRAYGIRTSTMPNMEERLLGPIGIWSGSLRRHPDAGAITAAAATLEELGYGALFVPGGVGGDDLLPAVDRLLSATTLIRVLTGVLNIWMHDVVGVAANVFAIEQRHAGRLVLGLGISHAPLVDRDHPNRYSRPLATMRSYLDELDSAPSRCRRTSGSSGRSVQRCSTSPASGQLGPPLLRTGRTHAVRARALGRASPGRRADGAPRSRPRDRARGGTPLHGHLPRPAQLHNALLRHGYDETDLADGGSDRLVDEIVAWGNETRDRRSGGRSPAGRGRSRVHQVLAPEAALPVAEWTAWPRRCSMRYPAEAQARLEPALDISDPARSSRP